MTSPERRLARPGSRFREFVRLQQTDFEYGHAFETLFVNLKLVKASKPLSILLVTSPYPQDGKSTVVVNLAIAIALSGKKILLVDGDLRRPTIHTLLGLDNRVGFADVLAARADEKEAIHRVTIDAADGSQVVSIDVITGGQASASDARLLGLERAGEVLRRLAASYDILILDSPPIESVGDALALSRWADGTILVLKAGEVRSGDAERSVARLKAAGGTVLGTALNFFDARSHGDGLYNAPGYYSYSAARK